MTTVSDLLDRYKAEEMEHLSERTHGDYLRHLEVLRAKFGHFEASALKPKDIGQWLAEIPPGSKGRIQRSKIISVLSCVYKLAVGKWWVVESCPTQNVILAKGKPRTRYVTDEEFNAVRSICSKRMQIAMDLALLTGQRQGDILSMEWDSIDPYNRLISVVQAKTGKAMAINITPALEEVLVRAKNMPPFLPQEYVLQTRNGKRFSSAGFRSAWRRKILQARKLGLIKSHYVWHDLRSKCASDNKNIQAASDLLGHQDVRMTKTVYDRSVRVVQPLR